MSEDSNTSESKKSPQSHEKVGFGGILRSVLWAAVGVQKRKNLEADFAQSSPIPYIVAGIIFTVVFLGTLILVAKIALAE